MKYPWSVASRKQVLLSCTCDCLAQGRDRVWITASQRRSFEGWLKVELAAQLYQHGLSVHLEQSVTAGGKTRVADLVVGWADEDWLEVIFLKTVATAWRVSAFASSSSGTRGTGYSKQFQKILEEIEWAKGVGAPLKVWDVWEILTVFPADVGDERALIKKLRRIGAPRTVLREDYELKLLGIGPSGQQMAVLVVGPFGEGAEP